MPDAHPPEFVPGLRLAADYYAEVVRPLLAARFPGLRYAAALLGPRSEVLGFDTARSTDHDWGPRLQVFLPDHDAPLVSEVDAALAGLLPPTWRGRATAFARTRDPVVRHRVDCTILSVRCREWLGLDPRAGVTVADWLATPTQRLAELTGGAVFHDGTGELGAVRAALAWYPDDVWRYVLACQWQRIAEEEAEEHNRLGLTAPLDPASRRFHDRPYRVLGADRFAAALRAGIADPELRDRPLTGAIDQFVDNTTALTEPGLTRRFAGP